ncbi:MMPL family transporter [Natronosporangium hydrolyticum]|uniref:MMPL family transporter n=1 Tax=Natronosporangium hydrolyticum TaxID=2811111 RepID=A0A895YR05_9ACTN|nr:MMPL family transporter [Natronosporangium hydrolyticum]QSB16550.1 MMPL family transporter [Natronosporangium hydrolyticum]
MTHTTTPPAGGGPIQRLATWSIRHPWWAIGGWVVFVAAALTIGATVETRQATAADFGVGEAGTAQEWLAEADFPDPVTQPILITGEPADAQAAASVTVARLGALPEVAEAGPALPSEVNGAVLVPVTLAGDSAADQLPAVQGLVDELDAAHPQLRIETAGGPAMDAGINDQVDAELASSGALSIPVTLVILLVVFGALVAAGVPLLLGFSAVLAATGLWALASQLVPDVGTVPQVILLIGLAVSVDYSLFYLRRLRQERQAGHDQLTAARVAAATSGRAVVVSAATSMIALTGAYLAGEPVFQALGTGVILVIGVAMLGAITVMPALLATLGRSLERPRVPLLWRLTDRAGTPRLWPALLAPALRAPRTTVAVVLAALLALALPAVGMSMRDSSAADLPRTIPAVQSYDRLAESFPGQRNTHQVVVTAPADQAEPVRAALAALAERAAAEPLFAPDPAAEVLTSPSGTVSTVELAVPYPFDDPRAAESLTRLRGELLPAALAGLAGAEAAVAGVTADNADYTEQQRQRLPWAIGVVVLLTVLVMAAAFRSVVVAVVAGILNLLSVAAAFGVLTLVFQHTWAEGLLGFTSTGHIVNWVPLFLFVILFGLSMDYHVYVVSRVREAAAAGLDTRAAVETGMVRAAGVVCSAAAVMLAIFSLFATLSFVEMKQVGVGLAVAVAIDATLVRMLLLPAVMNLLGRANWWPGRLSRGHGRSGTDRAGHRPTEPVADTSTETAAASSITTAKATKTAP